MQHCTMHAVAAAVAATAAADVVVVVVAECSDTLPDANA